MQTNIYNLLRDKVLSQHICTHVWSLVVEIATDDNLGTPGLGVVSTIAGLTFDVIEAAKKEKIAIIIE